MVNLYVKISVFLYAYLAFQSFNKLRNLPQPFEAVDDDDQNNNDVNDIDDPSVGFRSRRQSNAGRRKLSSTAGANSNNEAGLPLEPVKSKMVGDQRQFAIEPDADEAVMIEKSKKLAAWAAVDHYIKPEHRVIL